MAKHPTDPHPDRRARHQPGVRAGSCAAAAGEVPGHADDGRVQLPRQHHAHGRMECLGGPPRAQARAEQLNEVNIVITAKAGDEGKLFGSIGTRDIADALTNAGLAVDRAEVRLPNGALRHTGEFNIAIQLHHDVVAEVLVTIVSE